MSQWMTACRALESAARSESYQKIAYIVAGACFAFGSRAFVSENRQPSHSQQLPGSRIHANCSTSRVHFASQTDKSVAFRGAEGSIFPDFAGIGGEVAFPVPDPRGPLGGLSHRFVADSVRERDYLDASRNEPKESGTDGELWLSRPIADWGDWAPVTSLPDAGPGCHVTRLIALLAKNARWGPILLRGTGGLVLAFLSLQLADGDLHSRALARDAVVAFLNRDETGTLFYCIGDACAPLLSSRLVSGDD